MKLKDIGSDCKFLRSMLRDIKKDSNGAFDDFTYYDMVPYILALYYDHAKATGDWYLQNH